MGVIANTIASAFAGTFDKSRNKPFTVSAWSYPRDTNQQRQKDGAEQIEEMHGDALLNPILDELVKKGRIKMTGI